MARGLNRGEVRFFRFSPPDKQRRVLLLTKTSAMRFLSRVTVAPITSTVRGPSEVVLGIEDGLEGMYAVNLDQIVTVLRKHLGRWVALLRRERMREVCIALGFALGCEE